jgi:tape measure domain-containing protein
MAQDLQRLIVSLEARTAAFEKAIVRANSVANRQAKAIESRFAQMNGRIGSSIASAAKGWIGALAAGFTAREFVALSDAATRIDNSLKVAGLSGAALEDVYQSLAQSAKENAAPVEALVELYSRASLVQKELGVSTEELRGFAENVAVALRVSGKSAAESSGALLQLSQALGAGTVRAEEFNSIQEGALPVLQAVAAGLEEAGGSVAKLRGLVIDGKVSSEAFFRAFEAGAPILQEKVAEATFTVGQSVTNLNNALIDAAREFNAATGASENLAGGINDLANAISDFDVSGFIAKISEAHGALETFLNDLGNAQVFKDLAVTVGVTDETGAMLNLDAEAAKAEARSLEREVELLQATIENNTTLEIDNTEALARLGEVQARLATLRAGIASMPVTMPDPVSGKTAVDLSTGPSGRLGPRNRKVETVSIKDFAAPAGGSGGKKGGGGKSKRENEQQREIEQIKERTAATQAETEALKGLCGTIFYLEGAE